MRPCGNGGADPSEDLKSRFFQDTGMEFVFPGWGLEMSPAKKQRVAADEANAAGTPSRVQAPPLCC